MKVVRDTATIVRVIPSIIWSRVATLVTANAVPASTAHAPKPLRVFISLSLPGGHAGHVGLHDGRNEPVGPHHGVDELGNQQGFDEHRLPAEVPYPQCGIDDPEGEEGPEQGLVVEAVL